MRGVQDKSPLRIMLKTPSAFSAPKAKFGARKIKKIIASLFPFKSVWV